MNHLLPWRVAAWALGVVPLAFAVKWTFQSLLGPNPVEFLEHYTGDWTLRLLLTTLAMTPLRKVTRLSEPIRVRRILGLWTYAFLCLHFSIYLVFDLGLSVAQLGADLVKRTYITLGFSAWLMLLPLAITSTNAWQRRLKRRWVTLHQLIYPAAILGCTHYYWLVKADTREPLIYLAILLALLAFRVQSVGISLRRRREQPPAVRVQIETMSASTSSERP
ncbi:MAG: sulfoxide reductase heme-binding subunit YedZ [Proteobacteria bacterium]|nr:sulfoxide reductase heme-binding subunit YedZ [Pseudomonadota bacterium]